MEGKTVDKRSAQPKRDKEFNRLAYHMKQEARIPQEKYQLSETCEAKTRVGRGRVLTRSGSSKTQTEMASCAPSRAYYMCPFDCVFSVWSGLASLT